MKKTLVVMVVAVMILGTMSVAFADASWGPASIFAKLSGMEEEDAYNVKVESGLTFGELAKSEEYDFYDKFKELALAGKEVMIAQLVEEGKLTEEQAKEILLAFENCDGTKTEMLKNSGLFGLKAGNGQGNGLRAQDGEGEGTQQRLGGNGQARGMGQMRRAASN